MSATTPETERRGAEASVDELVTALLTASRALVGVSARSLAEVEDTVTLTQFRTLVVLDGHSPINLNGLADRLAVNASTAMRMIDRLRAAGLVTRHDDPADRRQVILGLTPDGRRVVRQVTEHRRAEIARIVTAMPSEQRSEFFAALRAFAAAAGETEPRAAYTAALGW